MTKIGITSKLLPNNLPTTQTVITAATLSETPTNIPIAEQATKREATSPAKAPDAKKAAVQANPLPNEDSTTPL
jgi:hypothetical protein